MLTAGSGVRLRFIAEPENERRLSTLVEVELGSTGVLDVLPVDVKRYRNAVAIVPYAMNPAGGHSEDIAGAKHLFTNLLQLGVARATAVVYALEELIPLRSLNPSENCPRAVVVRRCASVGQPTHGKNRQAVITLFVK